MKTSLKKWIRSTLNFIALVPIRQMLPNFSGVEFLRTVSKYRKRKRKSLSCVPVLDKTWNEALSGCSRAVTKKPIAFLPFSLPSPPSLFRTEAGEKEKKKQESARSLMGREKRSRAISFFFFFCFFIGIPSRSLCEEERRRMVWKLGPYRHQHCLSFRLL